MRVLCDGEVFWSYNMALHYRFRHSLITLPDEFIISREEVNQLKAFNSIKNSKKTKANAKALDQDLNTGLIEIN